MLSRKLRPPALRGLARERLLRQLDEAQAETVLVLAPAGSGKTTLLAQAYLHCDDVKGWYGATAEDVDEVHVVAHLARALWLTHPVSDLGGLLAALEERAQERVLLVVDDVHELIEPAAAVVERFLRLRPPWVRLLLGARPSARLDLEQLVLRSGVRVLDADDLRFRSWEVEDLFALVYEAPLAPDGVAALTRRTGGWAAALALFHLSTGTMPAAERRRAAVELSGPSRRVRTYLAQHVLAELPAHRRDFLVRTCALGVLTGALCDQLLEITGSHEALLELEHQQLFTDTRDDGQTFRYHEVLQRSLELALLEQLGDERARGWYRRCAGLLEAHDHPAEALRAYGRAEDWTSVARLTRAAGDLSPLDRRTWEVLLPESLSRNDPWLALAAARRLARSGQLEPAARAYRAAEELLPDPVFRARCQVERTRVEAWLPDDEDDLLMSNDWVVRLRGVVRGERTTSRDPLLLGLSALAHGDLAGARTLVAPVEHAASGELERQVGRLTALAAQVLGGDLGDAETHLDERSRSLERVGQYWLADLCRGLVSAVRTARFPSSWRRQAGWDLVRAHDERADQWGALLLALAFGVAHLLDPASTGVEELVDAVRRADLLGAGLLALQARALIQWRLSGTGQADPAEVAAVAAVARSAGAPGALVLTQRAALALGDETVRDSLDGLVATHGLPPALRPAPAQHPVALRCFDGFSVLVRGRVLDLARLRPRARALLRVLAVHAGHDVHREVLVDLLWPDADVQVGARRLQVAVSSLRQAFEVAGVAGGSVIHRAGEAYGLDVSVVECDVLAFREAERRAATDPASARAARLAAVRLHSGLLLPEDGPAEWVVELREGLRLSAARLALELAEGDATTDPRSALWAAHRAVDLDPLRDRAWDVLATLYESSGDVAAAARTRARHREVVLDLR